MPDIPTQLAAALGDRYVIERELGHGGNATVYLARDRKHPRQVAIKVLSPELALSVRAERFLREIEIAAGLTHPHILSMYDSGTVAGVLYYVMPYIAGESLRDRLQREPQLPVADTLQIAREVAAALDYAHRHDVVHRDIKPENILLSDGHAVVADFGIARALTEASGQTVTQTGIAVGTPVYMSPEQAAGSKTLDGRSDVYSLGCVVYEMLAGHPPFTGESAQEILAHHALDPVPSLRKRRPEVPREVEDLILHALAKRPAERVATAAEFAAALSGQADLRRRRRWPRRRAAAVFAGLAALLAAALWWRAGAASAALDPNVVVVLPFRVSGGDPTVNVMREGMVDLLAAKFTGEGGLRARDPQAVLSAWRRAIASEDQDLDERQAIDLARRLGAGHLLLGGIVATQGRVTLSAALFRIPGGGRQAGASVAGPPDSITDLVDRLTASLVARGAGVEEASLSSLTTTSLPALEKYLAGRAARRRGRLTEAVDEVVRALEIDSTFAAAAMALGRWAAALQQPERLVRGRRLAWQYRERLSARDRDLLPAYLYGDYPPRLLYGIETLRSWESATEIAPDEPETWFSYGQQVFNRGHMLEFKAPVERAAAAYRRAIELDSGFALALFGLVEVSLPAGDTAAARRYLTRYIALDSAGDLTDVLRWRVALETGDERTLAVLRARFDSIPVPSLQRFAGYAQISGTGLEDAERAAARLRRVSGTRAAQYMILWGLHQLALNRGRPRAALELTEAMEEVEPRRGTARVIRVLDALFWEGDTAAAAQAARRLQGEAAATGSANEAERESAFEALCAVELWRLSHGDRTTTARTVAAMRAVNARLLETADDAQTQVSRFTMARNEFCAPALALEEAGAHGGAEAGRALRHVDSVVALGGTAGGSQELIFDRFLPLVAARWHERAGQLSEARRALRRRPVLDYRTASTAFLSTYLVEEGRVAARTGDRDGAIRAYQHYLALRWDPEPSLRPEVERVRAELARLITELRSK